MKTILLTQGKEAIVDNQDHAFLSQWKWCYQKDYKGIGGYAVRTIKLPKPKAILMHNVVAKWKGVIGSPDHRNRNKLDNRRHNLRAATDTQNHANCDLRKHNTSGYRGVSWHKATGKWSAKIRVNKKYIWLKLWPTAIDAACAYNKAALKYFGDFAVLNRV